MSKHLHTFVALLGVTLLSSSSMGADAAVTSIYGSMISNEDGGIYEIPLDGSQDFKLVAEDVDATAGGFYAHAKYYCNKEMEMYGGYYRYHYVYDAVTWKELSRTSFYEGRDCAYDLAYDPTLDCAFGCFMTLDDERAPVFGSLDLDDFSVTRIGAALDRPLGGVAISADGIVYGIDYWGYLYKFDKFTGSRELVGDTKVESYYTTSAVYDDDAGVIYYISQNDDEVALYSIDPVSAVATKKGVYAKGIQFAGLYIPRPDAVDAAPAAAESLSVSVSGPSRDFKLEFTSPGKTFAGDDLAQSELSYEVCIDGELVKSGVIMPGTLFSETLPSPHEGFITVAVFISNSAGRSPVSVQSIYVGADTPLAVSNLTTGFDQASGSVTLTWDGVENTGIYGGYVDPESTSYVVTRFPDGKVYDKVLEKRFEDTLDEPSEGIIQYYYTVAAVYNGKTGEAVKSGVMTLGCYQPPYAEAFDDADAFSQFTVINIKAPISQNTTWQYVYGCAKGGGDSWIVTPSIRFNKGYLYNFSFNVKGEYGYYDETFEVAMGNEATAEGLSKLLIEPTTFRSASYKRQSADFAVDADGIYHIGIHYCSKFGMAIRIDDLSIPEGVALPVPSNVTLGDNGNSLVWSEPEIPADMNIVLNGYNVYRDGVRINEEPVADTVYSGTLDGKLAVSAVYDKGESLVAEVGAFSGIGAVPEDGEATGEYYNLQGIRVNNPGHGTFIVKRGDEVRKVIR